jgi:hypothetical protein
MLENSLVIPPFEVRTKAPAKILQARLLEFCAFGASESIHALEHGDIVVVDLTHELDSHSSMVRQVFLDERLVRAAVVACRPAINRIERFAKVAQDLGTAAVCFVLAELHHAPQHLVQSLLLLPAPLTFVDHLSQRPRVAILVVQVTRRPEAVTACTTSLLIITF